ncbi:MAG: (d)CMP kinase [Anaerolineaceae bacterium]|nr:(d)CMP kinase [Anaerolineaceae bacterium]
MEKIPNQIAMDGTAASGKTTVGKIVAKKLDYLFFDTGIMYRVAAYGAWQKLHDVSDKEKVSGIVQNMDISLQNDAENGVTNVLLDGENITDRLHLPEVDKIVSTVAAYPAVRAALTQQQRRIGLAGRVVMVGRDIGTVVMPDAELKVYLEASAETRAKRRYLENLSNHIESETYEMILADIIKRDKADRERTVAPLRPADDAVIIHTDDISAEEVAQKIFDLMD